ncbi:MAG: DnaJ domain-containing protein [Polyangiaceae bacterium]|nr:DnaJ domain-containing protein [Polyangiaceae bacterium]
MPAFTAARTVLDVPKGQTPAAEGTLGQTPLVHLYVYLLDKSLTGTMVLTPPAGLTVGLFVQDGGPTRAQLRDGVLAEDRATLERALVDLCLLPVDTRYGFYPREDFFAATGSTPIRIEPLATIMAAARACGASTFASSTLRKVAKAPAIKLASNAAPERFRLSPEERALVERLRKQALSLTDLITTSGVPEQIVRGVIYALTITRHLDFGIPARPPVGIDVLPRAAASSAGSSSNTGGITGVPASWTPMRVGAAATVAADAAVPRMRLYSEPEMVEAPPSSKVPASHRAAEPVSSDKRRADLEAKLAKSTSENHFEVLGIHENAAVLEIRDAYFGMARMFHPDKLADMPDLKPRAQAAFARITAAYNELSDDKRRAAYLAKLKAAAEKPGALPEPSNAEEQAAVSRAVNAAFEAQKAEVYLKKNELTTAEAHALLAVKADPDQPAYAALLVWIQAQMRPVPTLEEGKPSHVYDDLITSLDQILKKEPDFERALYYRGILLQRSGQADRAFKDFSRALELNPRNIEAAREVRLYNLRHKTEDNTQANRGGGLLGKLFKR